MIETKSLLSEILSHIETIAIYVDLPLDEDKLLAVSLNHQESLKVLDRVVTRLSKQRTYDAYCQVFLDQSSENIIQIINVKPVDFKNYIWIPHESR